MKRRLLLISDYFVPGFKAGGPIKSILNLSLAIDDAYDILIITRNHDFGDHNSYTNVCFNQVTNVRGSKVVYLSKISFKVLNKFISHFKPHVIHLNSYFSLFTIIILILKKAKFVESKIVLSPRGELLPSALEINYLKKKLFITWSSYFKLYDDISFHCTSQEEVIAVKQFYKNKIFTIDNLASADNCSVAHVVKPVKPLRLVYISRIRDNKNLLFALEILQNIVDRDLVFDIYGPIEDDKYWAACLVVIEKLPTKIKCRYGGIVNPEDVKKIMHRYQVFFLPSKTENFGHVIVEAMQVGLIPLISTATPWNDLQEYKAGWAIQLNKKEDFISAIKLLYSYNEHNIQSTSENVIRYIKLRLDNSQTIERYHKMYKNLTR